MKPQYLVFLLLSTIVGCASIPMDISDDERDSTGQFDGKWILQPKAYLGHCKLGFKRAYMEITEGVGKIAPSGPTGIGNISRDGDFSIEVPLSTSGDIRHHYAGNLQSSTASGRVFVIFYKGTTQSRQCAQRLTIKKFE